MAQRVRQAGRPALSGIPISSLQGEIQRRKTAALGLLRKRARLVRKLAVVEAQLRAAGIDAATKGGSAQRVRGVRAGGGGRRRPRNEMNLVEALAKVLDGKTLSVTEACEAVQQAGYRTSSKTFRVIVNQALLKSPKFKKIERGQYTLRR